MKISQREARRLKKRVAELEEENRQRRNAYSRSYPGGVNICTYTFEKNFSRGVMEGAQKVGCVLIAKLDDNELRIYAVK